MSQYQTQAVADAISETWVPLSAALIKATGGKTPIGAIILVAWHDGEFGTVHLPNGIATHEGMQIMDRMSACFRRTVEVIKLRLNTIAKTKSQ